MLVNKFDELSLWIIDHISEMSSNVCINLYLKHRSIAIYGNLYSHCLCHFRLFFWSVNCKNFVYKLCITFWKRQDTQKLFILQCISTDINRKINFNCLLLFKLLLLFSKLYELRKLHNFFLTCSETEARFIFDGF